MLLAVFSGEIEVENMIFDNHSHTVFSSDSEMEAEAALEAAARQGLGLVFTEHYDYDYINTKHYKKMEFRFDAAGYWEKYLPYRGDSLRLGVEIGLSETSGAANREFLQGAPFDLVIGSIHIIDMLDLYYPDFYSTYFWQLFAQFFVYWYTVYAFRHLYVFTLCYLEHIHLQNYVTIADGLGWHWIQTLGTARR